MKKFLLWTFLYVGVVVFGQSRDLYSLAKGEYLGFNALFDQQENLYGYVAIYGYGKSGEKTKKFEYVFLDRNLNPVSNKEFEGDLTAANYFGYLGYNNKLMLSPSVDEDVLSYRKLFHPRTMEIDLKKNEVSFKTFYELLRDGSWKEVTEPLHYRSMEKDKKAEMREKGSYFDYSRFNLKDESFLIIEKEEYSNYIKQTGLKRFDKNRKLLWEHKYNKEGDRKKYENLTIIEADEKYVFASLVKVDKKKDSFFLQVFDSNTGKMLVNKPLDGLLNQETWNTILHIRSVWRNVDNDKTFKDKIVIVGRLREDKKQDGAGIGFARWIIDKKTFEVDVDILKYEDFKPFLPKINEKGIVERGYSMAIRDLFFLEDGSVGLLFEKFKESNNNWATDKTTDMVYAFTDKDFKLKDVKVLEKQKTRHFVNSDYLFSQYLNNGKDVVFFYRDYQKDAETGKKHWNLFINTLINGKFNQEMIRISEKEKYFITPYIAKEGYILLREYNEKDKYNQIRLERLNY